MGVSIAAGEIPFTAIPDGAHSTASDLVSVVNAPFVVAYAANPGFDSEACTLPMLITRPEYF